MRALRLPGAGDRARGARTAALLATPGARPRAAAPPPTSTPSGSPPGDRGRRRARRSGAHTGYVAASFGAPGWTSSIQRFAVPGRGSSRNVIGALRRPALLPARRDGAHGHDAERPGGKRQRVGPRRAGGARRPAAGYPERCDVWLVATGAEERIYTGSPDHLGALALARRVRAGPYRRRLRWALSLDEVAGRRAPARPGASDCVRLSAASAPRRGPGRGRACCAPRARRRARQLGARREHRQLRPPRVRAARPARGQAGRGRRRRALPPHAVRPAGASAIPVSLRLARRVVEDALEARGQPLDRL